MDNICKQLELEKEKSQHFSFKVVLNGSSHSNVLNRSLILPIAEYTLMSVKVYAVTLPITPVL